MCVCDVCGCGCVCVSGCGWVYVSVLCMFVYMCAWPCALAGRDASDNVTTPAPFIRVYLSLPKSI
jgi:hypothetical protein